MSGLSPLNANGMRHLALERENKPRLTLTGNDAADKGTYRRYVCPECSDLHESKYKAEDCCPPDVDTVYLDPQTGKRYFSFDDLKKGAGTEGGQRDQCPCCARPWPEDVDGAAGCCLWRDFGWDARYRIARRVEAGATWESAITEETKRQ